ncbi:hypothetical protein FOMPIDRAFT_150069 [Fomitopsis schrenkii]|uniref:Protein phosphatase methylesterase 1 n=1 Tax=Fomitopsis schrenkii TaxID=2126942 RepID=S8F2C9_FOMSC|nr:hypothetical protein FOMPIDRAFT_150069 [Fomitopsis schrenkii]
MSDLYRSALSARISKLPMHPPGYEEDEEDEAADSLGSLPASVFGVGPTTMPGTHAHATAQRRRGPNPELSPLSASAYFAQATQIDVQASGLDVRAYHTAPRVSGIGEAGTVMVCHHGAGQSALTFALMAGEITDLSGGACGMLALDCRGHGKTITTVPKPGPKGGEEDFSLETLTEDFVNMLKVVYPDPSAAPTLLLVGHSLGGSVIVRACPRLQELKYRITGVAVLDIVEEFTLEALPKMHSLLDARPEGFNSQEDAIEWHVKTQTVRNPLSARVSVPAMIQAAPEGSNPPWIWRTPLRNTAPYWTSWFTSLSKLFLSARTARLLVLAGTERLDRELMIGQMQGKFQLSVITGVGHMLQEDDPRKLAGVLVEFWRRNERVVPGVKKVGER